MAGEERRREIALAARRVIAEKGLEGLRMRAVADAVGINIATLHYHVTTKEDLIALVTDSIRDDFIAQDRQHDSRDMDALARLKQEFADFREIRRENPQLSAALAELSRHAWRDPEVAKRIAPLRRTWTGQLANVLRSGIEEGAFRGDLDVEAFAGIIVATLGAFDGEPGFATPDLMNRYLSELIRSVLSPSRKETFDGNAFP